MKNNLEKYKEIIELPHYTSKKYLRMSIKSRAAQFAPFAALTGFSDRIKEASDKKNSESIK